MIPSASAVTHLTKMVTMGNYLLNKHLGHNTDVSGKHLIYFIQCCLYMQVFFIVFINVLCLYIKIMKEEETVKSWITLLGAFMNHHD